MCELEERNGALPETVESITGGGGRHLFFRWPGRAIKNKVALAPGLDIRADGDISLRHQVIISAAGAMSGNI